MDIIHDPTHGNSGPGGPVRPEFNVYYFVSEAVRFLRAHGITVEPTPAMMHTASIAAADMLRALGVIPTSASAPRQ